MPIYYTLATILEVDEQLARALEIYEKILP